MKKIDSLMVNQKFEIVSFMSGESKTTIAKSKPAFSVEFHYNEKGRLEFITVSNLTKNDKRSFSHDEIKKASKKEAKTLEIMRLTFDGTLQKLSPEVIVASWLHAFAN